MECLWFFRRYVFCFAPRGALLAVRSARRTEMLLVSGSAALLLPSPSAVRLACPVQRWKMAVATTGGAGGTIALVRAALASRAQLAAEWHAEGTDCYRLFHGAVEGAPGCTLDRYGDLLLWQTFRAPEEPPDALLPQLQAEVEAALGLALTPHWNDRRKGAREGRLAPSAAGRLAEDHMATELGLRYRIEVPPPGRDPLLYLDFRAARR